jgi:hypothetical protein
MQKLWEPEDSQACRIRYKEYKQREDEMNEINRAQASDYSRKPAPLSTADIIAMFFAGVLFTLLCAIALGSL